MVNSQLSIDFDITRRRHKHQGASDEAHQRIKHKKIPLRRRVFEYAINRAAKGITLHDVMRDLEMSYPTASARLSELKAEGKLRTSSERRDNCAVLYPCEDADQGVL